MRILACADKFRGTLTAASFAEVVVAAAENAEVDGVAQPMADGGEGTLDAFGGPNRTTEVTGPLGDPVEAAWRLRGDLAVIEMARASGLELAGGADGNDPVEATTAGTGELIAAAVEAGARHVIVGLGGSATTDGGLGALRTMAPLARFHGITIEVACDVRTRFVDAATVFGPQKGASPAQVKLLTRRLERLVQVYAEEHGVEVGEIERAGAAGGLGGGLVVAGARLGGGFEMIADAVELYDQIEAVDLVVTGEGRLDATSFDGKVVGGVAELARAADVPCVAVVGQVAADLDPALVPTGLTVIDLAQRHGLDAAMTDTAALVTAAVGELIADRR